MLGQLITYFVVAVQLAIFDARSSQLPKSPISSPSPRSPDVYSSLYNGHGPDWLSRRKTLTLVRQATAVTASAAVAKSFRDAAGPKLTLVVLDRFFKWMMLVQFLAHASIVHGDHTGNFVLEPKSEITPWIMKYLVPFWKFCDTGIHFVVALRLAQSAKSIPRPLLLAHFLSGVYHLAKNPGLVFTLSPQMTQLTSVLRAVKPLRFGDAALFGSSCLAMLKGGKMSKREVGIAVLAYILLRGRRAIW